MSSDGLKYFPLMIDRWIAGTRMMSLEAKGAYLEILIYLYEGRGRVVKDVAHVSRILGGIHGNKTKRIWREIEEKFVRNQHGYTHRLVTELLRNGGKVKGLSSGAHPRAGTGGFADSTSTSTSTRNNHPCESPPVKRQQATDWQRPEWVNPTAWADFEQHRREIRKPMSNMARKKAANQLQGMTRAQQQQCVDMTIQNRWQGLFPEKVKSENGNGTSGNGKQSVTDAVQGIYRDIANGDF